MAGVLWAGLIYVGTISIYFLCGMSVASFWAERLRKGKHIVGRVICLLKVAPQRMGPMEGSVVSHGTLFHASGAMI